MDRDRGDGMADRTNRDAEYLDALKREVYRDIVTGFLRRQDIDPILTGARNYLDLRNKGLAWLLRYRSILNRIFKRGMPTVKKNELTAQHILDQFSRLEYICDQTIAEAVCLSLMLQKPLLIEGEPGVGKTEIAKVMAAMVNAELIRLQCYEGLDENKALYEWNYQKQLLYIQGLQHGIEDVFSDAFLMVRPLLKAILSEGVPPVLLIDEIDKADEEFEAFLLEILSDFQVSIPEFGTIQARSIPHIVITNNDVRELTHALKRRCIYLYIDYPTVDKERRILMKKVPGMQPQMAGQIASLMHTLRSKADFIKKPSIAEGIDFGRAVIMTGGSEVDGKTVDSLLPTLLKNKDDLITFRKQGGGYWLSQ